MLEAAAKDDPAQALLRILEVEGLVELPQYGLARNLAPAELDALTNGGSFLRVGTSRAPVAVTPDRLAALCDAVVAALAASHHAQPDALGPTQPALIAQLRRLAPEAAIDAALAELAAAGRVVREGPVWRLPEHRPQLTRADERLWQRVRPMLAVADLRPPRVRELASSLGLDPEAVAHFLNRAERLGHVARVAANRFFLPETLARLAGIAQDLADGAPEGTFTAAHFKDRSGVGRNLTIQVLEYLDKVGATRRQGDARIMLRGTEAFG
jgi:selenocysteine-specific elongation factor